MHPAAAANLKGHHRWAKTVQPANPSTRCISKNQTQTGELSTGRIRLIALLFGEGHLQNATQLEFPGFGKVGGFQYFSNACSCHKD